jgi:hypothetical protein
LVDGDFEPLGFVVAAVFRQEKHSLRTLVLPVQDKLDFGLCDCRAREAEWKGEHDCADEGDKHASGTERHWRTPVIVWGRRRRTWISNRRKGAAFCHDAVKFAHGRCFFLGRKLKI